MVSTIRVKLSGCKGFETSQWGEESVLDQSINLGEWGRCICVIGQNLPKVWFNGFGWLELDKWLDEGA